MTDEERAKEYHAIHNAEEFCDDAHYQFKKYMHALGSAARYHRQSAMNQAEHDFQRAVSSELMIKGAVTVDYLNALIYRCIDVSKRDLETGWPIPYAFGHRSDEEGESWPAWAAFNIADIPSDIDVAHEHKDLPYILTGWVKHYSGSGRSFSSEPYYTKSRTRILVKQFRGLDI